MTPGDPQETSTPMTSHHQTARRKESPNKTLFTKDESATKLLEETKNKLEELQQDFIEYKREKNTNEKYGPV